MEEILQQLIQKYQDQKQDPVTYLKGLYHAKPITYWDYIEVDSLLSLQKPRTHFPDELIFIMYHQITELVLKMLRHELTQIVEQDLSTPTIIEKVGRMNRYTDLLISSFTIMSQGMSYDEYNEFRNTLAPASGFQSAQFRYIELACTDVKNLVNAHSKQRMPANCSLEDTFKYVYWQEAGLNHQTGEKSMLLKLFEEKYLTDLIAYAKIMQGKNLMSKFNSIPDSDPDKPALRQALREFDEQYNINWPLTHLNTAQTYLNKKGENKAATGGSDWQKYLHPAFQQRKFFPELWSAEELANWAKGK